MPRNSNPRVHYYRHRPYGRSGSYIRQLDKYMRAGWKLGKTIRNIYNQAKSAAPPPTPSTGGRPSYPTTPHGGRPKPTFRSPGGRYHYRALAGIATAKYKGKFKKPKRIKGPTLESQSLTRGYHSTTEVYGTVADPHCVYISHSTYYLEYMAKALQGALFRALFRKANITVDNKSDVLSLLNQENSRNSGDGTNLNVYYIVFMARNVANNSDVTTVSSAIPVGATFESLIGGSYPLYSYFYDTLAGSTTTDVYTPHRLLLIRKLTATSSLAAVTEYDATVAEINLTTEHITLYVSSELKIQNRTKADLTGSGETGDSLNADRVDNQPVYGYIYGFKNGDPRMKSPPTTTAAGALVKDTFNVIREEGIKLTRAVELTYDTGYNEPPNPKLFANCNKTVKVVLQPGDMKKSVIFHKWSGMLVNVLKRMACRYYVAYGGAQYLTGVPGKCEMFGLEEILRTASSNPITLAYECQKKIGCFTKSKKSGTALVTSLQNFNYDDVS